MLSDIPETKLVRLGKSNHFIQRGNPLKSRRFFLMRNHDVSGVSGTGIVAEGILFSTGKAVINWLNGVHSVGVFESIEDLTTVHGHNGATVIQWVDQLPIDDKTQLAEELQRSE